MRIGEGNIKIFYATISTIKSQERFFYYYQCWKSFCCF